MLASKTDLADLKTKADNLDVNKIKAVPADLSKPSNVVDMMLYMIRTCVW